MSPVSNKDIQKIQVSSVVKNDKNFGKQNIFDGNEETCWRSDEVNFTMLVATTAIFIANANNLKVEKDGRKQGKPQWISLEFKQPHTVSNFSMQFQGGFVGQNCQAEFTNNEQLTTMPFHPEDVNAVQKFTLSTPVVCKQVKFLFQESTDFFGRIIVYLIDFQ